MVKIPAIIICENFYEDGYPTIYEPMFVYTDFKEAEKECKRLNDAHNGRSWSLRSGTELIINDL